MGSMRRITLRARFRTEQTWCQLHDDAGDVCHLWHRVAQNLPISDRNYGNCNHRNPIQYHMLRFAIWPRRRGGDRTPAPTSVVSNTVHVIKWTFGAEPNVRGSFRFRNEMTCEFLYRKGLEQPRNNWFGVGLPWKRTFGTSLEQPRNNPGTIGLA